MVLLTVWGLGLIHIYVHLNFIAETQKGKCQAENTVWRTEVTDGTSYLLSSKPVSLLYKGLLREQSFRSFLHGTTICLCVQVSVCAAPTGGQGGEVWWEESESAQGSGHATGKTGIEELYLSTQYTQYWSCLQRHWQLKWSLIQSTHQIHNPHKSHSMHTNIQPICFKLMLSITYTLWIYCTFPRLDVVLSSIHLYL